MDVAATLRGATLDDVEQAVDNGYFQVPAVPAADLLAFFNAMLDQVLGDGVEEDQRISVACS